MARSIDQQALDRARILQAAYAVLDEAGLDGLTMRALAGRLSVKAPALYWHVADKAELIALIAGDIYARARPGDEAASAETWLVALGRGLAAGLQQVRDGARLLAMARPGRAGDGELAEAMARPLVMHGYSVEQSLAAQAAVISLTLGWALYRANTPMAEYLSGMFDLDGAFEQGLARLAVPKLDMTEAGK